MAYRVVREALEQERATIGGGLDGESLPEDDLLPDGDPPDEDLPGGGLSDSGL
jgi:hypothetical protein